MDKKKDREKIKEEAIVEEQNDKKDEKKKKDEKDEKIEELEGLLKRAVADYINLQRRFEDEKREIIKYASKELIVNLLPAFDALFLAGKYTEDQGVKLTIQRILEILRENGIEKIVTENVKYNAETMECIEVVPGDDERIVEEVRPGFMLNGKLIRPAQVKVGKVSD